MKIYVTRDYVKSQYATWKMECSLIFVTEFDMQNLTRARRVENIVLKFNDATYRGIKKS